MFWRFWRFWGVKNRQKTGENEPKITGLEKHSSGTVFGPFLVHFWPFSTRKTVQNTAFFLQICSWKTTWNVAKTVQIPMFLKDHVQKTLQMQKTLQIPWFLAQCAKKPCKYRVFCAFFLILNAENCVNSMVLERFWTPGKQKLLVFTWFCEPNAWTTLVCAWFSRVFSCAFINFLNQLTGPCILTKRYPPRARATLVLIYIPFLDPFAFGGSAGVPVCEACQ